MWRNRNLDGSGTSVDELELHLKRLAGVNLTLSAMREVDAERARIAKIGRSVSPCANAPAAKDATAKSAVRRRSGWSRRIPQLRPLLHRRQIDIPHLLRTQHRTTQQNGKSCSTKLHDSPLPLSLPACANRKRHCCR